MVCSLSLTVSTMLLAAWETMRSHVGSYRVWEMCGKIPGGTDPVSWLYFSRGRDGSKNLIIFIYNCYICILLIIAVFRIVGTSDVARHFDTFEHPKYISFISTNTHCINKFS
jgi:hypothetical protein